jgi:hypothetical protein
MSMTVDEHIQEAEDLLGSIKSKLSEGKANLDVSMAILARAQVHATLATALATQESYIEEEAS